MGEAEGRQVITSPTGFLLGLLFEYKHLLSTLEWTD